ncbi:MAG: hypothetical protein J5523_08070 [Muribaculaceae bacterium]|nr:hypothetical protein [Muribaculaceae bacterium]
MENDQELNKVLQEAQVAGDAVAPDMAECTEPCSDPEPPALEQEKPAFSEVVAQAAQALGLSDAMTSVVQEVLAPLEHGHLSHNVVKLIAHAISRDEDLKNADAAGYLRGRNEKIELVNRAATEPPEVEVKPTMFPRYAKRSFWDDI